MTVQLSNDSHTQPGGAIQVLCIEDDDGLAQLMRRRLVRNGMEVDISTTAEHGARQLEEKRYAVVIVDYWMPGQNGMDFLRGMASITEAPPIIMVTGADDARVAVEAMKLGAADFVLKDWEARYLDLLPSVIDRVVKQQRNLEQRQKAEALAQVTLESIGDAVITTDAEGHITYLNPVAEVACGWPLAEALGRPVEEVFAIYHEASGEPLSNPIHEVLAKGEVVKLGNHTLLRTRNGYPLPIDDSAAPIRTPNGTLIGAVLVFQDVTTRRENERNLELFAKMFQHTSEGIVITDSDTRIIDVNRAFSAISGYRKEEVLGKTPALMKSGRHDPEFFREMWAQLLEAGQWQGEIWDRRKNGEVFPKWLSINAVRNRFDETTHYVAIFSDITAIKKTEERLHRMAHYDPLTQLPNRTLFNDRLQQAIYQANRYDHGIAVMFLDLDRFKLINDSLGHRVGDQLLTEVAQRLAANVRESDTVARLGGDEFTVILNNIDGPEAAAQIAQKIVASFHAPFVVGGETIFTSTSIGISTYPQAGLDAETLTKSADRAMYRAKQRGRNTYRFFHDDTHPQSQEQLSLENDLRQALSGDQLRVYYQPQYELRSGEMIGAEALVRWEHPQHGLLLPARFIPIAEESGQIVEIGRWVLQQACLECARWQRKDSRALRVAVNVSGRQLMQGNVFIDEVRSALEHSGLPAQLLELELTESNMMQGAEHTASILGLLKDMGVAISIDDFGTGYSSLSYLKRFPVDTLKIDSSFIHEVHSNGENAAISRAIIALAESLDLQVVAEGVENEEQLGFLRQENCRHVQGFFFSEAVPAEQFSAIMQRRQ